MKNVKKLLALALVLTLSMASSCSLLSTSDRDNDRDRDEEETEETETEQADPRDEDTDEDSKEYDLEWGSFTVTHGWVYVPSQSNDEAYCFCEAGNEDSATPPNNIVVRYGTNYYAPEDSSTFAVAILDQCEQQAAQFGGSARLSSTGTVNGNDYLIFELDGDPYNEQIYFVGDHEFVMIGTTVFDEDASEDDHIWDVTEDIFNSFEWPD